MLLITNWDKWQTFRKDRGTPPWIKLHRCIMTNPEWSFLSDAEKGQLVSLWIVGADKNGALPTDDATVLRKIALLDKTPNVSKFIELGFLSTTCQPLVNHLPTINNNLDAPEERRGEERRGEYCARDSFDSFWQIFPKKKDKAKAKKWWLKTVESDDMAKEIIDGLNMQLPDLSTRDVKYIPLPTTWLNNSRWEDEVDGEAAEDDQFDGAI